MVIIQVGETASCDECASDENLVMCTIQDICSVYHELYCNDCLNKFELDTKNYRVLS